MLQAIERRQKDVSFYGIILSSYILCSIKSMYQGMDHIWNANNPNFVINFDVFSYAIPFVSFVLDHSIKRIINSQEPEKSIFVFIKLSMIVYYLGIYVLSLELKGEQNAEQINKFFILTTINLLVFPVLSGFYSYLLYKGKLN